jgi:hypothetical protein
MTQWEFVGACVDGQTLTIDGVDVWSHHWVPRGEQTASVTDPAYGQRFTFHVYEIQMGKKRVVFAAGEFSNCMWGFYIPKVG